MHTHKYICTPPVMCSLYHIKWLKITHWYQNFTFQNVFSVQTFFTCKIQSYICWLDAIRLCFSCETNNTYTNGANNQNTHTHTPNT